jgi:hypothetical protein
VKLAEALENYLKWEEQRVLLAKQIEESAALIQDIGKKVFCLVRKANGGTGEMCQFQVGENQYSVTAGGTINRINVVDTVDGELTIE